MRTAGKHLPLLAALVSVVLWASAFVGIRAAGRSFSPGALALGRLAVGSVLLGAVVWSRPFLRLSRRELAVLGGALCLVGVYVARRLPKATDPFPAPPARHRRWR